jgi:hypothetical protein
VWEIKLGVVLEMNERERRKKDMQLFQTQSAVQCPKSSQLVLPLTRLQLVIVHCAAIL